MAAHGSNSCHRPQAAAPPPLVSASPSGPGDVIDRAAIDSWATRLGAIAVVQFAAGNADNTPFYQALVHIVLVALVVLTTGSLVPAMRDAMREPVSPWKPRAWLLPAVVLAGMVMPAALAFPTIVAPLVDWVLNDRNKLWISLAGILFGAGMLLKLAVCCAARWLGRRLRAWRRGNRP